MDVTRARSEKIYLVRFVRWLESPPQPTKSIFIALPVFILYGNDRHVSSSQKMSRSHKSLEPMIDSRVHLLFPLAYATVASTSINRSLTTGDVFGHVNTSSRVFKNLRDIIC